LMGNENTFWIGRLVDRFLAQTTNQRHSSFKVDWSEIRREISRSSPSQKYAY
jgi:hypothetical protein